MGVDVFVVDGAAGEVEEGSCDVAGDSTEEPRGVAVALIERPDDDVMPII